MIYKPTEKSNDIVLCVECNHDVYESHVLPIIANLKRKAARGVYDPERAIDAWYTAATAQAAILTRQFETRYSVTDRYSAAVELERDYREEVEA